MRAHSTLSWLSVFASSSTLVCCALPALMVTIGAGAALAGLVSAVPQLVWLSEQKVPLFIISGMVLAGAGALQWRARKALACPADPALAEACAATRDFSVWVWWFSVAVYFVGLLFAFIAPLFL